ncbi:L-aminoadipate-semialdehyde dehydrogenase-phosphopantetheinyl transferase [Anthonomus grandis grandis]|uniref:L-aminoadipate-semialdehyde dehydrogenase-phosphopantetheinyl transferase n=1 Tax=Anthonomus grandis grandis TaxID=2921223 RepID=UPI0021652AF0|nr:L-aminoadipate-semialdehyde dehydrogenase-phosphopantetheinyl transferase [Anthonomus grandis grandis]
MSKPGVRWCFNISKWSPTYQELLLAVSCIQTEEKIRLNKFYFNKDFKYSLIGRLMMRKFVSENCQMDYSAVKFIRDEHGRPLLENSELNVSFNVSHQGDYTVFVGECDSMALGVDVMKLEYTGGKSLHEFFRVMKRNFSTEEWKQVYAMKTKQEQIGRFCRLWSLKEAYTKAVGVGITMKLDDLTFTPVKDLSKDHYVDDTRLEVEGKYMQNWKFQEILIDDEHCVSIATNQEVDKLEFKEISFKELMENAKGFLPQDESYCLEYFKKPNKSF